MELINGTKVHRLTQEDRIKGGKTSSQQRKYASLQTQSYKALCKNCKARCILKQGNIEKAKNHHCTIPEARCKALWYNMPIMEEEVLEKLDRETLFKLAKESRTTKDLKLLHDAIMNKKKTDYPKVQQMQVEQRTINLTFADLKDMYDSVHGDKK